MKLKAALFIFVLFVVVPLFSVKAADTTAVTSTVSNQQTDCTQIADPKAKFFCVISQERLTNDPKTCNQIDQVTSTEGLGREDCYYDLSLNTKDSSICNMITGQPTKDMCVEANATSVKTCSVLKTATYTARCLEKFSPKKLTTKLCNLINKTENGGYEYQNCYYTIATATNNLSLCKKIPSGVTSQRNSCFFDIAQKNLSLKDCNLLPPTMNPDGRYWCITVIGRLTHNNKKVCNLIPDTDAKQSCIANIPTN